MNPRASFLLTLPVLALLAAGCATSSPGVARSTEADDVYFSSSDRLASRYPAPAAAPAYDPTAPPAPDGSVANPDYTGQPATGTGAANQNYYSTDNAYAASPRVTSPYYGSFNQYNSGYAYDPFWSGSSLAIGCGYGGYGGGWGYAPMAFVPVYAGPRMHFGVSFGYGWGYSSWAAPMYGWAGPTFYNPFYDPFWGPSYGYGGGYGGYGYGWGYPAYGYGGGGWRNGYQQGFNDGYYSGGGGGGYRNGRNVTYGPRLDRSAGRGSAYADGGQPTRTTRNDGNRTVAPGAGGSQPAYSNDYGGYSGYGGGAARRTGGATRVAAASPYSGATANPAAQPYGAPAGRTGATRVSRVQDNQPMSQPASQPASQPVLSQPAAPIYQSAGATRMPEQPYQPAAQPQVLPQAAPQPARREGFFQRAARNMSESQTPSRAESPSRNYSSPPAGGGNGGGGGFRSGGGGGGSSGGARRTR